MSRSTALEAALRRARVGEIRLKERLADYTTLKVGGPCRALVRPPDLESLGRLIEVLGDVGVAYFPLGGGSNLLISDDGFDGVVIATDALQEWETDPPTGLTVGAGVATARVVKWAVRSGLSGMEGLTGVPGSIGGACVMNAGGRGGNISDCLEEVEVVTSPPEVHVVSVPAEALSLAYRSAALPAGSIIGRARLRLRREEEKGAVKRAVDELLAHRMATQPAGVLSVGSVFKNPPGDSAGRLIESCGLKGEREGPVVVSEIHANYFVNTGGATAGQVCTLIDRVRSAVREETGIELQGEVITLGFAGDPLPERAWIPAGHSMRRQRDAERVFGRVDGET